MFGVVVEGAGSSGFGPLYFFSAVWDVLFEGIEGIFDEIFFAFLVGRFVQIGPIVPVGVGARDDGVTLFSIGSSTWVVEAEGARGDISVQEQVGAECMGCRAEEQIAGGFWDFDIGFDRHVDLGAAVIEADGLGVLEEFRVEVFWSDQIEDGGSEVGVAYDGAAADGSPVDFDALDFAVFDKDFRDIAFDTCIDAVLGHFGLHFAYKVIGTTFVDEDTFGHEVREDDTVGDGWIFEGRAVGVGDRFHQESDDIFASGEELVEQFAGAHGLVVVEVHRASRIEELGGRLFWDSEMGIHQSGKIFAVVGCRQGEHRVIEADVLELDDVRGDIVVPVAFAAFEHSVGEAVEGDIEGMSSGSFEPGGKSAEFVVLFEEKNAVPCTTEDVG